MASSNSIYLPPSEKFRKLEARNTKYRFDPERDIRWDDMDLPGMYFTGETIGGIDPSLFDSISGLSETFNWAMGISTSEYFIALEKHTLLISIFRFFIHPMSSKLFVSKERNSR